MIYKLKPTFKQTQAFFDKKKILKKNKKDANEHKTQSYTKQLNHFEGISCLIHTVTPHLVLSSDFLACQLGVELA